MVLSVPNVLDEYVLALTRCSASYDTDRAYKNSWHLYATAPTKQIANTMRDACLIAFIARSLP